MIKAEPKTILSFLWTYFEVLRDLFDLQQDNEVIRKEAFQAVLHQHKKDIKLQLMEYKIVRQVNDDYELRDVYYKLIEFILFEFRPLLPEEIDKFGNAITELFRKIKKGVDSDRDILLERLKALSVQIKEFSDAVEKNSIRLLNETRDLKGNVHRVDYREKIQKASFWIEYYIIPLNRILDVNHSQSISNKLLNISEFANQRRLNYDDEGVRQAFEKLYHLLIQTNDDVLRQSKILTNELLPLIERIRTESQILTGWIEFLKNPYRVTPPKLLKMELDSPYSNKIYLNTFEYFEQFTGSDDAIIDDDQEETERWIFKKKKYKEELVKSLPIVNFFEWCNKQLKSEDKHITNEKLFALTCLLFEDDLEVTAYNKDATVKIKTETANLNVPKLKVTQNGIPAES
ncbi:MAG TPA: hypothetical protein VK783_09895 [Bacteroidia bacterium]|jgi:hypothetical protein|nr:hypothetical protein [Bacteroidia bacterium]